MPYWTDASRRRALASMVWLGSTPWHATVRAHLRGHLGGQEARAGADVEHALARLE